MFIVKSANFDFHAPIECATYSEALVTAKGRGFQARITVDGELVAVWCPLYGTKTYNRSLAS